MVIFLIFNLMSVHALISRHRGSYTSDHFIWNLLKYTFSVYHMTIQMRFYHLQSLFISMKILDYCHGRCHDITCSSQKCHVTCGHNNL